MKKESYLSFLRRWNVWRKRSKDTKLVKFCAMLRLIDIPSLEITVPVELTKRKKPSWR